MGMLSAIKSLYYKTLLSFSYGIMYTDLRQDKLKRYTSKFNLKFKKYSWQQR